MSTVSESLSQLEVLVIDCQATAAAPRGHLLEMGWARAGATTTRADARLIALPGGERIPPAVARLTGISDRMLLQDGVEAQVAWCEFAGEAASLPRQPAPAVIHFSRFEQPFLRALAAGVPPLDIVCTHDIARRLLPDLPRCGVRALAGYFGRGVATLRRSADHVEATAFVWRELVRLLGDEGIESWEALRQWLAASRATRRTRRVWPMPRDVRLSLPDAPGLYRLLRTSGDVLYVGKAASLRHRVNSYFRRQHGLPERTLEMLSQARGLAVDVMPSALEAALAEPDAIKRHRPPYNVALTVADRAVWFAAPDLSARSPRPTPQCPLGPMPSAAMLDEFDALAAADGRALGSGRWCPDAATFAAGYARLCAGHPELARQDLGAHDRLLRLGTRLWREGRRDHDVDADEETRAITVWTPELVQRSLEWLSLRGALARRRASWLTRLVDASVVWTEPGAAGARLIVVENGEVLQHDAVEPNAVPPVPPGYARSVEVRREVFTLARFDRLRVLSTELKRLVAAGAPVAVRLGVGPPLADARLASILWWV